MLHLNNGKSLTYFWQDGAKILRLQKEGTRESEDGRPKRKCRKIMSNVDCGLETKHVFQDVQSSDNVFACLDASVLNPESPPSVENKSRCGSERHDPETLKPETNVHRKRTAGSGNTHTAKGQVSKNPEPSMNLAVRPAEIKRTLRHFKKLIQHGNFKTRGSQNQTKVQSSVVEENVCLDGKTCDNTDRSEDAIIGLNTENIMDVTFDLKPNRVITAESHKSQVDNTAKHNENGNNVQGDLSRKDIRFQSKKGEQDTGEPEGEEMGAVVFNRGVRSVCRRARMKVRCMSGRLWH